MKKIQINSNSWHYRFINGITQGDVAYDLCGYTRQLIGYSMLAAAVLIILLCLIGAVGDFFAWVSAMIVMQAWIDPYVGAGVLLVVIVMVALFAAACGIKKLVDRDDETAQLVRGAYESFHDKVCFRIEVK